MTRRRFLLLLSSSLAWMFPRAFGQSDGTDNPQRPRPRGQGGGQRRGDREYVIPPDLAPYAWLSLVLGRVSDRSVTVSAVAQESLEGYFELGTAAGRYDRKTDAIRMPAGIPTETLLDALQPNTRYFYRLQFRRSGDTGFSPWKEGAFHTQRAAGSAFTFTIQGDSHPERPQMSDPALYSRTLLNAAADQPDFHICMGDDFSVDTLRNYTSDTVAMRYALQRPFLGIVGRSAPLFLLNGNHEQASLFNFNQKGAAHDVAIWAQNARNRYFPTLAPDSFYTGDSQQFAGIGSLRDYYSWTWGDALFVVLDNYWHAPVLVDTPLGGDAPAAGGPGGGQGGRKGGQGSGGGQAPKGAPGKKGPGGKQDRDWWDLTLGEAQYQWFKRILEQSPAKFKFVFAHHVLGSGRGGVDEADLYEWGGRNRRGEWEFDTRRPGWELPVHQLMAKHGVTIFFQGHDHLYARQERDGIIYQEVPMPGDQGYVAYNEDRYQSGVKIPNSGHLRVQVSPDQVRVDYLRCYLPKDESAARRTGEVAHGYTLNAKAGHA